MSPIHPISRRQFVAGAAAMAASVLVPKRLLAVLPLASLKSLKVAATSQR